VGVRRDINDTFPCVCCGFWTLTGPVSGSYEVCPVCFWEDDPEQSADPFYKRGANGISLVNARDSYVEVGACDLRLLGRVRSPKLNEIPPGIFSPDCQDKKAIQRGVKGTIVDLARAILADQRELVEQCYAIAALSFALNEQERQSQLFRIFEVVASELDGFPVGEVRKEWAPEALARMDAEMETYLEEVLPAILSACREIDRTLCSKSSR
jgi:hypothetical protein